MIIIKDNTLTALIKVQKPFDFEGTFYTILLQNTVTKKVYQYTLQEQALTNKLYYTFEINVEELESGEYYLLLISNPSQYTFEIEYTIQQEEKIIVNDEEKTIVFYVNKGDAITNNNLFIANTMENDIKILARELLRYGNYERSVEQYSDDDNKYITYKR